MSQVGQDAAKSWTPPGDEGVATIRESILGDQANVENQVTALEKEIELLAGALEPALKPSDPVAPEARADRADRPARSLLAHRTAGAADALRELRVRIEHLRLRVDL